MIHRCRNMGGAWPHTFRPSLMHAGFGYSPGEIRTKNQQVWGVGGASWWVWIEWPPHLKFASYKHPC